MRKNLKYSFLILLTVSAIVIISGCRGRNKLPEQVSFTATIFSGKNTSLYEVSLDDSVQLLAEDVTCADWSTDNQHFAFSQAGNIFIHELSSGENKAFEIDFWTLSQPVWSPDGDKLAFAGQETVRAPRNAWILDVRTGALEKISNCEEAHNCFVSAPDWSTDNRIAYGVMIDEKQSIVQYDPEIRKILVSHSLNASVVEGFLFGSDGANGSTGNFEYASRSLAWSPDNVYLAILNTSGHSDILLFNTKTQKTIEVAHDSDLYVDFDSPTWSSDGQWLLLRKLRNEQIDLEWEVVSYDVILANVTLGLSREDFEFNVIYESNQPLICPGNLVVKQ